MLVADLNSKNENVCLFLREFPVRLENPHVITPNQIWAGVVPAGPSCCSFNSSYRSRDSIEYKQELGNAIGTYHSNW